MARTGNHGQIIPRDAELLHRLYWVEKRSLPEIGRQFGVTHKSVQRVMDELGVPRRQRRSKEAYPERGCSECGAPVYKIRHAGNGAEYGRRCKVHWDAHRAALAREERTRPHVQDRIKSYWHRWYVQGAIEPKGEAQWLTKARALLRTAKRTLANPAASQSQSEASKPEHISQT